jgi:hypothetical protein
MKQKFLLITMLILGAFMQRCTEDEPQHQSQKVQLTFSLSTPGDTDGRIAGDLPDGSELVLSLVDLSGNPVMTQQRIPILSLGGSYMTGPIELVPGQYKVDDFMIALGSEIIFAAPRGNSPLAPAVVRPIPFNFKVKANQVNNIAMEVITTDGFLPQDFGYVSFGISVVNPLQIAVFIVSEGEAKLTSAEAFVYHDDVLIKQVSLPAKTNLISFKGSPDDTYRLVIRKAGYADFIHEFIYADLIEELDRLPWKIFLTPAFMLKTLPSPVFDMTLDGLGGVIDVDWGDGTTIETYDFSVTPNLELSHAYAIPGVYYITVTGAIDQITEFYCYYDNGEASEMHFEHLPALRVVRYGLKNGPKVIDLSNNSQLDFINIAGVPDLERIILPATHNIDFILVSGPNLFNTAAIDEIINSIHTNAVAGGIHNGVFGLRESWADEETPLLGPPSAAGLVQLDELRTLYGWNVSE